MPGGVGHPGLCSLEGLGRNLKNSISLGLGSPGKPWPELGIFLLPLLEEFRARVLSPCITEPCLQGMGQPGLAAVVPRGARLALVLAAQAMGRGVKPRRAWHWVARSPGAEEARGADVIPRKPWGLHLCSGEKKERI